jgi:kynureninase
MEDTGGYVAMKNVSAHRAHARPLEALWGRCDHVGVLDFDLDASPRDVGRMAASLQPFEPTARGKP